MAQKLKQSTMQSPDCFQFDCPSLGRLLETFGRSLHSLKKLDFANFIMLLLESPSKPATIQYMGGSQGYKHLQSRQRGECVVRDLFYKSLMVKFSPILRFFLLSNNTLRSEDF